MQLIIFVCNCFIKHVLLLLSYMCSIIPETAKVSSGNSYMWGPGICCWSQTTQTVATGVFKGALLKMVPKNYIDKCEPIVMNTLTLLLVILLCIPKCWHLDSNYCRVDNHGWGVHSCHCYRLCICWVGKLCGVMLCCLTWANIALNNFVNNAKISYNQNS